MNGMQPDECTPTISWMVQWKSGQGGMSIPVLRRDQGDAIELAKAQRFAGFETKLYRIEQTEVDF